MPMPVSLFFNVKPSTAEEVDIDSITDPTIRELAIKRNSEIRSMRELNELADKVLKEKDEAIKQFRVLDSIERMTEEEKYRNSHLTGLKLQKAMIVEKRRRELNLNAETAIREYVKAVAKAKEEDSMKCLGEVAETVNAEKQ